MDRSPLLSRRRFLIASLGAAGAGVLLSRGRKLQAQPLQSRHHLVWTWQFDDDGEPNVIGTKLLEAGTGIVVKSHDGVRWMSEFDESTYAVSGPAQVAVLANYYENAGIPFHAWCVVKGVDPAVEAAMAADVLSSGARSLFLNLKSQDGFWEGSPEGALAFGEELRRLQPDATLMLCIDPRPWTRESLPIAEFAAFCDGIALQQFWLDFTDEDSVPHFEEAGHPAPDGITPEFLVPMSEVTVGTLNLPLHHVGQGRTQDVDEFRRFLDAAAAPVSVWRFKDLSDDLLALLKDRRPAAEEEAARGEPSPETPGQRYTVVSGDTLSGIAAAHDVSLEALIEANDIDDPDAIREGDELIIP